MPEEDNAMAIWLGDALSARLESHTRNALRHILEASRAAAIPVNNCTWTEASTPVDRQGKAMQKVGSIDYGSLAKTDLAALSALPTSGRLTIFCSAQILAAPAKERRNFKLIFNDDQPKESAHPNLSLHQLSETILPLTIDEGSEALLAQMEAIGINSHFREEICAAAKAYNEAQAGQNYLLGAPLAGIEVDRQICAFASGGIGHSAARAADAHYSHLVEEARHWNLLARFRNIEAKDNGGLAIEEARLYMRRQDLADKLFERAWLLCKS